MMVPVLRGEAFAVEEIKGLILTVIQISLFLFVASIGLMSTLRDTFYLFAHPRLLLRSVIAINVVVPVFALLMVSTLSLTPNVKLAIVLLAISPVPPLVPGKELRLGGKPPYVCSLYALESLLSIVIVPLTVLLFDSVYGTNAVVEPGTLARFMFGSVFLPLVFGMVVHRFSPKAASRWAPVVSNVAMVLLLLAVAPVLAVSWPAMVALVGDGTVIAMALVAVVALVAGHLLGGPDTSNRTTLAIASAIRHPGIALLIAGSSFESVPVGAAVLSFLIIASLVVALYGLWRTRVARHAASS